MGCYIWYSEEGPLLAVPNVTAHPSTASVPIIVLNSRRGVYDNININISVAHPYNQTEGALQSHDNTHYSELQARWKRSLQSPMECSMLFVLNSISVYFCYVSLCSTHPSIHPPMCLLAVNVHTMKITMLEKCSVFCSAMGIFLPEINDAM